MSQAKHYTTYWVAKDPSGNRVTFELRLIPIGTYNTKPFLGSFWTQVASSLRVSYQITERDGDQVSLQRIPPEELENL